MNISGLLDLFLNPDVAIRYLPDLLRGLWVTVSLSIVVVLSGLGLGLALAILRLVSHRYLVSLLKLWVDCFRAVPPLAVLLLLFFGLPGLGLRLSAFWVLSFTLTCILAAFSEEIFWAGISAIHKGQWEASRSTGMTNAQTIRYVILPQAFKICIPPLTNRAIAITKNTALGTAIGMPELLNEAQTAQSFSGNATPLILAAVGYLIIFMPVMTLAERLEKRMVWGAGR
ncbi:polar amino acid ABC transporter permease (plasmid) [Pararhizobium polonicum]|uniref:Polar amino acid ABC transporter permease n=1 Tax=Pararhizobium polonicum TaxID=1612624 RepID=A0A1C7P8I3_9HYPH|nr:ABC transporter permease subunit [Pararhizobium polonicum]OBZ97572.1 polar amino acid ABC transporter permease [Pararhizobium polonicum]